MSTARQAKSLSNHAGFCDICKPIADEISAGNPILQLKIGNFAKVWLHKQTHQELIRWRNVRRGIWGSLPAFLQIEEVSLA